MFDYCQPTRIHFGAGRLREIGTVCARYGRKCLMVTTPDEPLRPLYERVKGLLAGQGIEVVHYRRILPSRWCRRDLSCLRRRRLLLSWA